MSFIENHLISYNLIARSALEFLNALNMDGHRETLDSHPLEYLWVALKTSITSMLCYLLGFIKS